jgi:hypothetical protein
MYRRFFPELSLPFHLFSTLFPKEFFRRSAIIPRSSKIFQACSAAVPPRSQIFHSCSIYFPLRSPIFRSGSFGFPRRSTRLPQMFRACSALFQPTSTAIQRNTFTTMLQKCYTNITTNTTPTKWGWGGENCMSLICYTFLPYRLTM